MNASKRSRANLYLSASLILVAGLSACGNKGKTLDPVSSASIIKAVKAFEYAGESFDETSQAALDMLGLWESDTSSWESREGGDGDYVYTGVKLPNGSIKRLVLKDVHMRGNLGPFVSSIEIDGLEYQDESGETRTRLDKGQVNFNADLHNHINNKIRFIGVEDLFNDLMSLEMGPLFTGSGYFDGLTVRIDDSIQMESEFIGWHPGADKDEVTFLARDLKAFADPTADPTVETGPTPLLDMKADLLSLKNFKLGTLSFDFGFDMNTFNPFEADYDSVVLKDISLAFDTADMTLPSMIAGLEGNPDGRYKSIMEIPSMTLSFSGEPQNTSLESIYSFYQRSGFENLVMSVRSSANLDVKNDRVQMDAMTIDVEGGAVLTMDYDISGIRNYHDVRENYIALIQEAAANGTVGDIPDSSDIMDDAMSNLSVNAMNVVLDDTVLLENVLAQMAEQQDVKIDVTRQQLKGFAMLTTLWFTDPYLSDLSEDFAESAQAFVVNGGGMKFSVAPEDGFKLGPSLRQAALEPDKAKEILAPLGADFEHIPD